MSDSPPSLLAVTLGDPAGIGPEVVARASAALTALADGPRLLLLGPAAAQPAGIAVESDVDVALRRLTKERCVALDTGGDARSWQPARAQAASGAAALAALRRGHELARAGRVDALVTAPVSKEALHLAGERCEGQTELLTRWDGAAGGQMAVCVRDFTCLLLTRHVPLREALAAVRAPAVIEHLVVLDATLARLRSGRRRIALCGLNPHAGEGGLIGREDVEILLPAVREARARGLDVHGPESPDAVFVRAADGEFDGVLALYHDQAFIPLKILGRDEGVTIVAGLSYLRVSPIHGTAFGLVGTGRASAANMEQAIRAAARWSSRWAGEGRGTATAIR